MTTAYQWESDRVDDESTDYSWEEPVDGREEFGGLKFGPVFFGWLCANALALLLLGGGLAVVLVFDLVPTLERQARAAPETAGTVAAAVLVLAFVVSYYAGGYVGGRMARYDGRRQGFVAWLLGVVVTAALVVAGLITGAGDSVVASVDLPSVPLDGFTVRIGGLVALAVAVLMTLLAALAGGKTGERFHRRIDRAVLSL